MARMPKVYNPVKRAMTAWVDLNALQRMVNKGKGGCVLA